MFMQGKRSATTRAGGISEQQLPGMPRETGNYHGRRGKYSPSTSAPVRLINRTFNGHNVGFSSLSTADDCCAYRDYYCTGPGRTFRRAVAPGGEREPASGIGSRIARPPGRADAVPAASDGHSNPID